MSIKSSNIPLALYVHCYSPRDACNLGELVASNTISKGFRPNARTSIDIFECGHIFEGQTNG